MYVLSHTSNTTHPRIGRLNQKRQRDREAQRALRQRTKEYIESLQSRVADLEQQKGNSADELTSVLQRNKELLEELADLRARVRVAKEQNILALRLHLRWEAETKTLPSPATADWLEYNDADFGVEFADFHSG